MFSECSSKFAVSKQFSKKMFRFLSSCKKMNIIKPILHFNINIVDMFTY